MIRYNILPPIHDPPATPPRPPAQNRGVATPRIDAYDPNCSPWLYVGWATILGGDCLQKARRGTQCGHPHLQLVDKCSSFSAYGLNSKCQASPYSWALSRIRGCPEKKFEKMSTCLYSIPYPRVRSIFCIAKSNQTTGLVSSLTLRMRRRKKK